MRNLSAAQIESFSSDCTSLCWAWRITRRDGVVMGFTDHDSDLLIDNITYEARTGFDAGSLEQDIGFSVNSAQANSVFSSDAITESDLRAGLYDGADVDQFRIDWRDRSVFLHAAHWMFGDVRFTESGFEVELIGRTAKLDRATGRVFSRHCDADLGDARCGLNLADFPEGTICPRTFAACQNQFDKLSRNPQSGENLDGGSRYS